MNLKYILMSATLLLTSCAMDYTQSPSGEIHFSGVVIIPVDEESGK